MAYCDRCGSYIPDGWTSCPACGYDKEQEAKQNQQAAAAQAHRQEQEKFAREEAEKRRAQRQAYDKVWAENEQRRRREEEELRRRQQEQEERNRQAQEQNYGNVRVTVDPDGTRRVQVGDKVHVTVNADGSKNVRVDSAAPDYDRADASYRIKFQDAKSAEDAIGKAGGKILPLISYLGPLCFIPLLIGSSDRFTHFHARQGLRLFIWSAILGFVGSFFSIGWAITFFQIIMAAIGIKNVINGEEKKLPYIGG